MDKVQKCLVEQAITTRQPMYVCLDRVLTGDAKVQFDQKTIPVGNHIVANIFPTFPHRDQKRYLRRHLKKHPNMKVRVFTTGLMELNTYLPYFPPDMSEQTMESLPDDEIKETLHHAMPSLWKKQMTLQGYSYLNGSGFDMANIFKTRIENLEI